MVIDNLIVRKGTEFLPIDSYDDKMIDKIVLGGQEFHFAKQKDLEGLTEVVADNAVQEPIIRLGVEGNTEQKQYEGYNLLDLDLVINEMNLGDDSWYKKDGSWYCEELGEYHNIHIFTNYENIAGSLTLLVNQKTDDASVGSNGSLGLAYIIHYTDGTTYNFDVKTTTDYREQYYTTDKSKTVNYIAFFVHTELPTYVKYIMVNKGELKPYEQYVGGKPSPNVEYPQPIENSSNVEVELKGKNLAYCSANNRYTYECTSEILSSNSLKIIATSTKSGTRYVNLNFPVNPNTKVRISYNFKRNFNKEIRFIYWATTSLKSSSGKFIMQYGNTTKTEGSVSQTITTKDTSYLGIAFYLTESKTIDIGAELLIENLMVTYDTEATTFEPYFEPTTAQIPNEVTLADGTVVPLRFAKVDDSADTLIVDKISNKVSYIKKVEYFKLEHIPPKKYVSSYKFSGLNGITVTGLPTQEYYAKGYCNRAKVASFSKNIITIGAGTNYVYWVEILDTLGFTNSWVDKSNPTSEEKTQAMTDIKAWLVENPTYIYYELSTPIEYDLTDTELGQQLLEFSKTEYGTNILTITSDLPVSKTDLAYWRQIIPGE